MVGDVAGRRAGRSVRRAGGSGTVSGPGALWRGFSRGLDFPLAAVAGHADPGEPREVGRGGEQAEVGVDLGLAADAGAAPAVFAAHQMADLALVIRAGLLVVRLPCRDCVE